LDIISSELIAFLATSFFIYFFRSRASALGLVDRPSTRKRHEDEIPVIGGIAILGGFLLTVISTNGMRLEHLWFILPALLLTGLGVLDDLISLSHRSRLLVQILAALLMALAGGVVLQDLGPLFVPDVTVSLGPLSIPFTIVCVVGTVNAYNMCDGIDGLAGTLALVALLGLGVVAFMGGQSPTLSALLVLGGCVLAFLAFNARSPWRKRAVIFLGDSGSTLLGFSIVWYSITLSQGDHAAMRPVTALWFVALPFFDLVATTLRRLIGKRSPFLADREHLHHLFISAGFSVTQTVIMLGATAVVFAGVGIAGQYHGVRESLMFSLFMGSFVLYYYLLMRAWNVRKFLGRDVCRRQIGLERRSGNERRRSLNAVDARAYEGADRRGAHERRIVIVRRSLFSDASVAEDCPGESRTQSQEADAIQKVVFVNRYFWPDVSATSQLLSDLAFAITETGRPVTVVTSRQRYDDATARLPSEEMLDGVSIRRIWTSRYGRQGLHGRAVDYLTFYTSALWRLWFTVGRGDVLVAMTDPPLLSIPAALVAGVKGAKLVNWHQDVFPEIASTLGVKGMRGGGVKVIRSLRNVAVRAASANVVLSRRMAQVLADEERSGATIRIIPNWSDGHAIYPVAPSANFLRRRWGLEQRFVVGYSGNMGRVHEFDAIIDAAERLANDSDVVFLFIGDGFYRQWIEREVHERGLTNVIFRPYQPREHLRESLGVPDVHFISLRPDMEGLVFPSKLYGVLAAGRPVLFVGAEKGDVSEILRSERCGLAVSSGDVHGVVDAILKFKEHPEQRHAMGNRGRKLFEQHYEMNAAHASWCHVLSPLFAEELSCKQYQAQQIWAHNRRDI